MTDEMVELQRCNEVIGRMMSKPEYYKEGKLAGILGAWIEAKNRLQDKVLIENLGGEYGLYKAFFSVVSNELEELIK